MQMSGGGTPDLELALLRRSLGEISGKVEHCHSCERALLIGERVYEYENGELRCALCRVERAGQSAPWHTVHTAAHGHSLRLLDRRPARRAA